MVYFALGWSFHLLSLNRYLWVIDTFWFINNGQSLTKSCDVTFAELKFKLVEGQTIYFTKVTIVSRPPFIARHTCVRQVCETSVASCFLWLWAVPWLLQFSGLNQPGPCKVSAASQSVNHSLLPLCISQSLLDAAWLLLETEFVWMWPSELHTCLNKGVMNTVQITF